MVDEDVLNVFSGLLDQIYMKRSGGCKVCSGSLTPNNNRLEDRYILAEYKLIKICKFIERAYAKKCLIDDLSIEDWHKKEQLFNYEVNVKFVD